MGEYLCGFPHEHEKNIVQMGAINHTSFRYTGKHDRNMTTIQLRAELFREMSPLLDSESALEKLLAYVKTLLPSKTTKDQESDERLEEALKKFSGDWGGNSDATEVATELRRNVVDGRTVETW